MQKPHRPGSPPHTRGKGIKIMTVKARIGITPAYAGKSLYCQETLSASGDHPRIRGEKMFAETLADMNTGSPPHTRGKATAAKFP